MKSPDIAATHALAPHHAAMLEVESSICEKTVAGRGYQTVDEGKELRGLGFADYQLRTPALLVPMYSLGRELVNYQIRPDDPRLDGDGKPIKYETPLGSKLVLDCHPCNATKLMNPHEPLWITEGCRKADSGASRGLVVISLQGVWGWMRDKAPHPDWAKIPLANRTVLLAFDADVVTKEPVQRALCALCEFLWDRRAIPYVVPFEKFGKEADA